MEVSGQLHAPAALHPWRLGGPQSLTGPSEEENNLLYVIGIEFLPSIPHPIATPTELSRLTVWTLRRKEKSLPSPGMAPQLSDYPARGLIAAYCMSNYRSS
jgi:hypothetical protein